MSERIIYNIPRLLFNKKTSKLSSRDCNREGLYNEEETVPRTELPILKYVGELIKQMKGVLETNGYSKVTHIVMQSYAHDYLYTDSITTPFNQFVLKGVSELILKQQVRIVSGKVLFDSSGNLIIRIVVDTGDSEEGYNLTFYFLTEKDCEHISNSTCELRLGGIRRETDKGYYTYVTTLSNRLTYRYSRKDLLNQMKTKIREFASNKVTQYANIQFLWGLLMYEGDLVGLRYVVAIGKEHKLLDLELDRIPNLNLDSVTKSGLKFKKYNLESIEGRLVTEYELKNGVVVESTDSLGWTDEDLQTLFSTHSGQVRLA